MFYTISSSPEAKRRLFLAGFALLFVAGILTFYFILRPKPTPETRIAEAFERTQAAAQRGDIADTLAIVSKDFRAGSLTKKQLGLLLFRARQEARGTDWRIEIAPPRVLPTADNIPDQRLVITRVVARDRNTGDPFWSTGDASITLVMREEPARLWGIFPSSEWRVISAPSLPGL